MMVRAGDMGDGGWESEHCGSPKTEMQLPPPAVGGGLGSYAKPYSS